MSRTKHSRHVSKKNDISHNGIPFIFKIYRKSVITIKIWFALTRFQKDLSMSKTKHSRHVRKKNDIGHKINPSKHSNSIIRKRSRSALRTSTRLSYIDMEASHYRTQYIWDFNIGQKQSYSD